MKAKRHPAATAPLCRNLLPKGFTGKGEAIRWRNELIVAVAQVHAAMTTVHQATKSVGSRFFYLERFRRNRTGAVTLRWRQTSGRYVAWPMLQPISARRTMMSLEISASLRAKKKKSTKLLIAFAASAA